MAVARTLKVAGRRRHSGSRCLGPRILGTGLGNAQVRDGTVGVSDGARRPRSERVDKLEHLVGQLASTVGGGESVDHPEPAIAVLVPKNSSRSTVVDHTAPE